MELDAAAELYGVLIFEWTSGSSIEQGRMILSDEQALEIFAVLSAVLPEPLRSESIERRI